MSFFNPRSLSVHQILSFTNSDSCARFGRAARAATVSLLISVSLLTAQVPFAYAQYSETETNNTKATGNGINLGTTTSATITGTSTTNADPDYYTINTSYTTAGIYRNQLQLNNSTQLVGTIRAQSQTSGVINSGTDFALQTSTTTGTATPFGFNQYYSFGGAGKTQSVSYRVAGATSAIGNSYTASFTSTLVTPTNIGSIGQGRISFDALANLGGASGTVATDTSIVILDANYNVYVDNVPSSATFGRIATNNNDPADGSVGFSLTRSFNSGTYYIAIAQNTLATNDAAAPDDTTRSNLTLDYDNVLATSNAFYDGNGATTRPADFQITNNSGNVTYTSSGQKIPSLYAVNFYRFTVTAAPEPNSLLIGAAPLGLLFWTVRRRQTVRKKP